MAGEPHENARHGMPCGSHAMLQLSHAIKPCHHVCHAIMPHDAKPLTRMHAIPCSCRPPCHPASSPHPRAQSCRRQPGPACWEGRQRTCRTPRPPCREHRMTAVECMHGQLWVLPSIIPALAVQVPIGCACNPLAVHTCTKPQPTTCMHVPPHLLSTRSQMRSWARSPCSAYWGEKQPPARRRRMAD